MGTEPGDSLTLETAPPAHRGPRNHGAVAIDGAALEGSAREHVKPAHLRRGWLVRRMLLVADVTGLTLAFVLVEVLFRGTLLLDNVGIAVESVIFVAFLPAWAVAAKLYGLYDRDEERATHSTADEVASVFHLLTVRRLALLRVFVDLRSREPEPDQACDLLGPRTPRSSRWALDCTGSRTPAACLRPERGDRRRR